MNLKLPALNSTPVGAGTQAGLVASLVLSVLNSSLPWWQHQPQATKDTALVLLTAAATYLGGWLKVVLARGQEVHLRLTASPLPTVEAASPAAAPPSG